MSFRCQRKRFRRGNDHTACWFHVLKKIPSVARRKIFAHKDSIYIEDDELIQKNKDFVMK